ncbi:hypothetical protein BDZ45DRAFT_791296 [Acephala macrosclerotiorum]|nr:hypothetical protein BDZ45DRAFT_791296 [Acephala macrosclerotiorum]
MGGETDETETRSGGFTNKFKRDVQYPPLFLRLTSNNLAHAFHRVGRKSSGSFKLLCRGTIDPSSRDRDFEELGSLVKAAAEQSLNQENQLQDMSNILRTVAEQSFNQSRATEEADTSQKPIEPPQSQGSEIEETNTRLRDDLEQSLSQKSAIEERNILLKTAQQPLDSAREVGGTQRMLRMVCEQTPKQGREMVKMNEILSRRSSKLDPTKNVYRRTKSLSKYLDSNAELLSQTSTAILSAIDAASVRQGSVFCESDESVDSSRLSYWMHTPSVSGSCFTVLTFSASSQSQPQMRVDAETRSTNTHRDEVVDLGSPKKIQKARERARASHRIVIKHPDLGNFDKSDQLLRVGEQSLKDIARIVNNNPEDQAFRLKYREDRLKSFLQQRSWMDVSELLEKELLLSDNTLIASQLDDLDLLRRSFVNREIGQRRFKRYQGG